VHRGFNENRWDIAKEATWEGEKEFETAKDPSCCYEFREKNFKAL